MTRLAWDLAGEKFYETGVDRGVLYIPDGSGVYATGVPWNGLVNVTESPTGGEANPQYADNIKYLNLYSAEEFGATIEAFTYPPEWGQFDGLAEPEPGLTVGGQPRMPFGLSYRTLVGNDLEGDAYGYKLHMVYGCMAAPSEKAFATKSDSPEPVTFSWELTTTPVSVTGLYPTSILVADSTIIAPTAMAALEDELWGDSSTGVANLPLPDAVIALIGT